MSTSTFQRVAFPANVKLPTQKTIAPPKAAFQTTGPTSPMVLSTRGVGPRKEVQGKGGARREMNPSAWVTVMTANIDYEESNTGVRERELN